ncbi:tyrosine-type recombinase/integrase [Parvibaculum sedimenti]|uniref:Tyrosine-type recombinase/integrase n=2 Tax=Parvibaculum sedimenti TaxID=2608632 RepID=A0A6N6VG91_9HYPH|nr:tyrosine-type recombinase/integrase [Parvibaculum sedimenti]
MQHVIQVAQRTWRIPLRDNPVKMIDKPKLPQGRDRRLKDGEFDGLIKAARRARNPHMEPLIRLAIETGMRQGELLKLRWIDVDLKARTAFLPMTKNGCRRTVPLSTEALEVIKRLPRTDERLFPTTTEAVKRAWMRIRRKIDARDLRFHDLRHEAASRFFEKGLNVPEVALITGHRDGRMLFRYTHLKAEDVAKKLA